MISPGANRIAVVTGGNKGLGYFTALQLALSGVFQSLIIGSRNVDRGEAAVASIQESLSGNRQNCDVSCIPLIIGDKRSHDDFIAAIEKKYGHVDVLINNAATAFKGSDPTPFQGQTKPTLDVNYRGTLDFTLKMLPLLRKGKDARIVNVASRAGYLNQIQSRELRNKLTSSALSLEDLNDLVDQFEGDVQNGVHNQNGWGNSNYGFSKLALICATKILARQEKAIKVNACCPGYCKTDMTSQKGTRPPEVGCETAVMLATIDNNITGEFFGEKNLIEW